MSVDNFKLIKPLLTFDSKDDFYFLQILQRKKDHKDGNKVNGTNNNSRLIKAYYINSVDYLDFITNEVIYLCELFNARAGINLNKRSYKKMALQHLKKVTDQILNEDYIKASKAYTSVCGSYNHDTDKKWILDIDDERKLNDNHKKMIKFIEDECQPEGNKFISAIPSKSGIHIIMKPFNVNTFNQKYPNIEIHKNNPTNLYIP